MKNLLKRLKSPFCTLMAFITLGMIFLTVVPCIFIIGVFMVAVGRIVGERTAFKDAVFCIIAVLPGAGTWFGVKSL